MKKKKKEMKKKTIGSNYTNESERSSTPFDLRERQRQSFPFTAKSQKRPAGKEGSSPPVSCTPRLTISTSAALRPRAREETPATLPIIFISLLPSSCARRGERTIGPLARAFPDAFRDILRQRLATSSTIKSGTRLRLAVAPEGHHGLDPPLPVPLISATFESHFLALPRNAVTLRSLVHIYLYIHTHIHIRYLDTR